MNVNYGQILDKKIEEIKQRSSKPSLLLHACCAPCSSAVVEFLNEYFDITLYFYNPNISPEAEYDFRADELKRLISEMNLENIDIIVEKYDNSEFESIAKGYEDLPEGGGRCKRCFELRLEKAIQYASSKGFDYVTTTLTISPHKNAQLLNETGKSISEKYNIQYLFSDFKKRNGYKRSCELSRQYNLYRQDYCGCKYSKPKSEVEE